ncbi:MAG: DNA-binding protein WhiA [Lachnospiraceae bacterium]|nr:DNA-binding protein WhiA [Lachnospiraceae bacterium]
MSFSKDIKAELAERISNARHCRIAEMAGILSVGASVTGEGIVLFGENKATADKLAELIRKLFSESVEVSQTKNKGKKIYRVSIEDEGLRNRIFEVLKCDVCKARETGIIYVSDVVITQQCCRRAFLRGAFLAAGSVSDPEKTYHFEIIARDMKQAHQIEMVADSFDLEARILIRKEKYIIVYIKDGSKIVDALSVMEAHVSMMNMENVRILKEMRNNVNRQVNCETANIGKTVAAAGKQIEDIRLIEEKLGLSKLAKGLEEVARLRISYPDSSLQELSDMMDPPIGRSGVNHRLKKLGRIADGLRGGTP